MKEIHGISASDVPDGFTIRCDNGDYRSNTKLWVKIQNVKCSYNKQGDKFIQQVEYPSPIIKQSLIEYDYVSDEEHDIEIVVTETKRGRPRKERRNTRPPTEYNLFIREQMQHVKLAYPGNSNCQNLKICVQFWNERKAAAL